jgi:hypothetical protein
MSTSANNDPHGDAEAWKYAEKALTWYGWGSPVGISIFLVSVAILLAAIHQAGWLR